MSLLKCQNCRRSVDYGKDCLRVSRGVLGPRGFVPLEDTMFCCERCLAEYHADPVADEREDGVEF